MHIIIRKLVSMKKLKRKKPWEEQIQKVTHPHLGDIISLNCDYKLFIFYNSILYTDNCIYKELWTFEYEV